VTFLLPDLAEELQRQGGFKAPVARSGLESTPPAIDEDSLTSDIIQRLRNQEIPQDSQHSKVMEVVERQKIEGNKDSPGSRSGRSS
jgi:hypothetical protein